MRNNRDHGNVMFIILVAVLLFAALAYAVTSSSRSGEQTVSDDKMKMVVAEMQNAVAMHRAAVQRMVARGVDVTTIDFSYPVGSWSYPHPYVNAACSSNQCRMYHPQGGGVLWYDFPKLHPELTITPPDGQTNGVFWTWVNQQGTLESEMTYQYRVTKEFCEYINRSLGITAAMSPASALGTTYANAVGPAATEGGTWGGASHGTHMQGRDQGCVHSSNPVDAYRFISVIYAR